MAAPALAYAAVRLQRRNGDAVLRYSHLPFLVAAARTGRGAVVALQSGWITAGALLAAGFAHPHIAAMVPVRGAIVICIDTSGSMATTDVKPDRAAAAVAAMRSFLDAAPQQTAVAVIAFANVAQIVEPLSRDRYAARAALSAVPAPNGRTAIGDALVAALHALPANGARAIVLITDGGNNAGIDPMTAVRRLAAAGVRLYTIGIGRSAAARALVEYARATGGRYEGAADAAVLRAAFASIGRTIWARRQDNDVTEAVLQAAGVLMVLTLMAGMSAGRYP